MTDKGEVMKPEAFSEDQIVIRLLTEEDLPGLEWDGEYTHYRFVFRRSYEEMKMGRRLLFVAAAGETVVGQIFIQLVSREKRYADGAKRAYLHSLRVRPAWQGRGLGTQLVRTAEEALRMQGFDTAVIAAGKDNPGARRLYERLGYAVFDEDPGVWYFTDDHGHLHTVEEPCWMMQKQF